MDWSRIHKKILYKMHRRTIIGGVHKSKEDIQGWFKSHLKGRVKSAIEDWVRVQYLVMRPTSYGAQYSLNQHKLPEIEKIIKEHLEEEI